MNWELENSAEILITSSSVCALNLLKFKRAGRNFYAVEIKLNR